MTKHWGFVIRHFRALASRVECAYLTFPFPSEGRIMFSPSHRRGFLKQTAGAGLLAGAGDYAFLQQLPALSAQEVRAARNMARVESDVEPLVRLIEDTPQNRLIEAAAERIKGGTSYQQLLAAVMLAGVRGIQPRPVGFKFHAVLVINSAHLAPLAAEDRDRWAPL